ncbi:MAG TPA: 1-(5-phosphoribosyl)-5-[(5-phosphoribosylamino)methylideneamino]imidazole-4-carboxamide isomerase [Tepidisphaeraceae bacterium]|nr:1-(5-phosphoribosyl)-5-[(5-phosphoribosylamino)methylideneamino]imidazole-4-carboxamide isomerase [Tepidisphaeraceae bacterium]
MLVIPSIDLRDGKVVRLQQGDYSREIQYSLDPIETAGTFEAAGAELMHVVDLDGAKAGRPMQVELIGEIVRATAMPVQVGGGVRSTADVQSLVDAGAARVVVGTKAIEDWAWFTALVRDSMFAGKIVLAIDAKSGMIATQAWTQTSGRRAVDIAREVSDWPLAGLLYTDVAKDGMLQGPNLQTTRELVEATKVPVIASGGVGNIEHIRQLKELPIFGVIVGRSLHEGKLDLAEAIAELKH